LRAYIVELNPTIELPLDLTPLMRESIFDGSLKLIHDQVNNLSMMEESFIKKIFPEDVDLNDLSSSPMINSLFNYITNSLNKIRDISEIEDPVETLEAISGIVLPDIDKLVLLVRDVQVRTTILDKV
jgi:hypothetical protein